MAEAMANGGEDGLATPRYDRVAAALHWLIALLVLGMLTLGFSMVEVPRQTPLRGELFNLHKSIGLTVLALMVARTLWRIGHRPPRLEGLGAYNAWLAAAVHLLLYLFLLVQPLAGFVASSLGRYGVAWFGLELPQWTAPDAGLRETFLTAHRLMARLIVGLILLHLAGSLLHLVQGRRDLLRRMWPWGR
jgi:cytochrome b561